MFLVGGWVGLDNADRAQVMSDSASPDLSTHEGIGYRLIVKARGGSHHTATTFWPPFDYFASNAHPLELCLASTRRAQQDGSLCQIRYPHVMSPL